MCYVTQTKVGMPWLLENLEINTVLKTSEKPLIRDLPLWQKQPDCNLLDHVVPAWLYHFNLIFDQEVAFQPVLLKN